MGIYMDSNEIEQGKIKKASGRKYKVSIIVILFFYFCILQYGQGCLRKGECHAEDE